MTPGVSALFPSPWGDRSRRGRVGVLGGSFNPAHDGHRHISLCALRLLRLDAVWWLVSPQNPLKERLGMAPLEERLAQAQQVAAHPAIRAGAPEVRLGTAYTVKTLKLLQQRFPRLQLVWLMGADNLWQIHRWRQWEQIFHRVPLAILDRGLDQRPFSGQATGARAARRFAPARRYGRQALSLAAETPPAWVYLPIRRHPASATALRAAQAGLQTSPVEISPVPADPVQAVSAV